MINEIMEILLAVIEIDKLIAEREEASKLTVIAVSATNYVNK